MLRRFRLLVAALAAMATVAVGVTLIPAADAAPPTVKIGMSAPAGEWSARLAETGPVHARRLFGQLTNTSGILATARSEVAAGRMPILSFKVGSWATAASGGYDAQLRTLTSQLDALPGPVFVAIHHEPVKDGDAAVFANMQRRVLPILRAPDNVDAGVIMNGFPWSPRAPWTDAQIAAWLPADVLRLAEIVAADTYHGGTENDPGENAAPKIARLGQWATRVGVTRLGIGEYNGLNAQAIREAGDAILADPRMVFAAVFNSDENNREGVSWQLRGDRLTAFRETLAKSRPTPTSTVPPTSTSTSTTAPTTTSSLSTSTSTTEPPPTTTTTVPCAPATFTG